VVTKARAIYTVLTLAICLPLYVLNPWVYLLKPGYTYLVDVATGRPVQPTVDCVGFVLPAQLPRGVRVATGELLCYDNLGRGVFESLRLSLEATPGTWVYAVVAYLYVSTSRAGYLEVVVEKPLRNFSAILVVGSRGGEVLRVSLGAYRRYRIPVALGVTTYGITLVLEASRPTRDTFRVGVYLGSYL